MLIGARKKSSASVENEFKMVTVGSCVHRATWTNRTVQTHVCGIPGGKENVQLPNSNNNHRKTKKRRPPIVAALCTPKSVYLIEQ